MQTVTREQFWQVVNENKLDAVVSVPTGYKTSLFKDRQNGHKIIGQITSLDAIGKNKEYKLTDLYKGLLK